MNKIRLSINFNYGVGDKTACFDIDELSPYYQAFKEPVKALSDGASIAEKIIFSPTPEDARIRIVNNRKKVAERISREMTNFLLDQMEANDTLNGYDI